MTVTSFRSTVVWLSSLQVAVKIAPVRSAIADVVLGLIRAGDGQSGDGLLVADDGAGAALLPSCAGCSRSCSAGQRRCRPSFPRAGAGLLLALSLPIRSSVRLWFVLGTLVYCQSRGILILAVDPVLDVHNGIAGGIVVEDVGFLIRAKLVGAGVV